MQIAATSDGNSRRFRCFGFSLLQLHALQIMKWTRNLASRSSNRVTTRTLISFDLQIFNCNMKNVVDMLFLLVQVCIMQLSIVNVVRARIFRL